jgi:hypothetical protein
VTTRAACILGCLLSTAAGLAGERTRLLEVAGATLEVALPREKIDLSDAAVLGWVESSARATAAYFGRFPVPRAHIELSSVDGSGVGHGTTYPSRLIRVKLGRHATRADLAKDWVLTHEMCHLGFPSLSEEHHWMEEGLATYVEPLGRVRTGDISAEKVWGDLVMGLPNGLPRPGDRGLDFTPTWGRTYWGGALFFLLADVEIRQRTGNTKGLEHALRAVVGAGGTLDASWSIERVIAVGDGATGVPVLRDLYDRMKDRPAPVDLDSLWKRLGVSLRDGQIRFDDAAPLAPVRRAITPSPSSSR